MNATATGRASIGEIARVFLTPRVVRGDAGLDFLSGGQRLWINGPAGKVVAAQAGDGPTVLLVHGWEGQARDLSAFAVALLDKGYRVIAVELPAHGESDGDRSSIPQAADALLAVQRGVGGLHAAIAHSVGAAVLVESMAKGLAVDRAVLVSAPAEYAAYARMFAAQAGLNAAETDSLIAELLRLGVDVQAVSLPRAASRMSQPALFLHSTDDRVVSIRDAEASVRAWRNATLLRFDGLGHRRILTAPEVVQAVISFVTAGHEESN